MPLGKGACGVLPVGRFRGIPRPCRNFLSILVAALKINLFFLTVLCTSSPVLFPIPSPLFLIDHKKWQLLTMCQALSQMLLAYMNSFTLLTNQGLGATIIPYFIEKETGKERLWTQTLAGWLRGPWPRLSLPLKSMSSVQNCTVLFSVNLLVGLLWRATST